MWPGSSQGPGPAVGHAIVKDTRPLREKSFAAKMRQDIAAWLDSNGIDVSPQILVNITSKDFRAVFQHLVNLLDPQWVFTKDQGNEELFMQPLRVLRYPFIDQLNVKMLATPGAMHTWPLLLGVLHWLAELGRVSETSYIFEYA